MNKFLFFACVLLALLVSLAQASAAETPTSLSLSLNAGSYIFGSSEHLEISPVYSLKLAYDIIGKDISDSIGIEAGISYAPTQSNQGGKDKINSYLLRIDALYPFQPRNRIVPYLALGVGGKLLDGPSISETNPLLNYGAGIKYYMLEYLALRSDIRHLLIFDKAKHKNFEYSVGLSIALDRNKSIIRIPVIDSDGDGVQDKQDLCAKTPRGVKVDKKGCPLDTDVDSVPDYQDKCPDTPKGTKVNKSGCPEVIKPPEKTPEPVTVISPAPIQEPIVPVEKPAIVTEPPGAVTSKTVPVEPTLPVLPEEKVIVPVPIPAAVAVTGPTTDNKPVIPAGVKMVFEFDTDKAIVKRKDIETAIKLWASLKRTVNINVTIEGHTDSRGSASYNLKLSRKRAKSIKNFLVSSFAINPAKITIQAFGFYQPIAENTTDDGRQKNRRAVAVILEEEE